MEDKRISRTIVAIAVLVCMFQLLWFGSKCIHQIDFDGMAYTGIARHLVEGQFHLSINAFRSPLLSWIIAIGSLVDADRVQVGKFVNVGCFVLCEVLLYVFARRLWRSAAVASVAVLLFALGRGLPVSAVEMVVPDFLFAALVLVYFLILLKCLKGEGEKHWFYLGAIHGLAYLAKAFALPWLALCTLVAIVLSNGDWRKRATRLAWAATTPALVAGAWAVVLYSKYGVFTTGTQLKTNLLEWTLRAYRDHKDPTYLFLTDTSQGIDKYGVDDPMPPNSWPWSYRVSARQAIPKLILTERRNLPSVVKEIIIVVTPGGAIAFLLATGIFLRGTQRYPLESRMVSVIVVAGVSLVVAYSMLVFDGRYLYPLFPLLLAVATRFLVADAELNQRACRTVCVVLVILGVFVSWFYPSSPFRRIRRDVQVVCYDAGRRLKAHPGTTLASVGLGPFQEHGMGWEAGYKAAYFAGYRIIGAKELLPTDAQLALLRLDLDKAQPNAILVWGKPADARYIVVLQQLTSQYPRSSMEKMIDPVIGEVGTILFVATVAARH